MISTIICPKCKNPVYCKNTEIEENFLKIFGIKASSSDAYDIVCNFCGSTIVMNMRCPKCGSKSMSPITKESFDSRKTTGEEIASHWCSECKSFFRKK